MCLNILTLTVKWWGGVSKQGSGKANKYLASLLQPASDSHITVDQCVEQKGYIWCCITLHCQDYMTFEVEVELKLSLF